MAEQKDPKPADGAGVDADAELTRKRHELQELEAKLEQKQRDLAIREGRIAKVEVANQTGPITIVPEPPAPARLVNYRRHYARDEAQRRREEKG